MGASSATGLHDSLYFGATKSTTVTALVRVTESELQSGNSPTDV